MTSYDKNNQKGQVRLFNYKDFTINMISKRKLSDQGVSALMYNRDDRSDSTPPGSSGGWPSRPPR
jgi:hypothetical protein